MDFVGLDTETAPNWAWLEKTGYINDPDVVPQFVAKTFDPETVAIKQIQNLKTVDTNEKEKRIRVKIAEAKEAHFLTQDKAKQKHEADLHKKLALDPQTGMIVSWASGNWPISHIYTIENNSEHAIVGELVQYLDEGFVRPVVGCGSRLFDMKYIYQRACNLGVMPANFARRYRQGYLQPQWRTEDTHVDIQEHLKGSLAKLSKTVLGEEKIDISHRIESLMKMGAWGEIEEGCLQHARLALEIAIKYHLV